MPVSVEIEPALRRGVVRLTGRVSGDLMAEALRQLCDHPLWHAGYDSVWDGEGVTELLMDPAEADVIVAITEQMNPLLGIGRGAFVMPRELDYMIARLFIHRTRTPERERRVFRTRAEALAWLEEAAGEAAMEEG